MLDAIVVGAGPAGSMCSLQLARAGLSVIIIDKSDFPRRKVCGEYLNTAAIRELAQHGLMTPILEQATTLAGIRLRTGAGVAVELLFCDGALSIARTTLDHYLLEAAKAQGVQFMRARVEDALRENGVVTGVMLRDPAGAPRSLRSRFVVAADGMSSLLAKKAGLTKTAHRRGRFALGGHYTGFGTLDGFIEMYVDKGAYFAINPISASIANVMVVVEQSRLSSWSGAVDEGMSAVASQLASGCRSFDDVVRVGNRLSVGPLFHETSRCSEQGMLLVGDAAGFIDPFTGQGIALALRGASQAAQAIIGSVHHPAQWKHYAHQYEMARRRDVRARQAVAKLGSLLVGVPFLGRRAASRLSRMPELKSELIAAVSGARGPDLSLRPAQLARLLI